MSLLPTFLIVIAIGCQIFSYWGLHTVSGNHTFDEMAGIVPLAVGAFGWLLALVAAVLWFLAWRPSRKTARLDRAAR